ncbi:hypothetical protein BJ508DRAFT_8844 [Ascobolus immersus RN42]|uniref:Uncharacterized protein n=1 Tax=Ascobolus immersus RN42 TaxID=1160509 RepID=A0A3N4HVA1_ASCIM|nr:hypothetical protein BJ508DRAFT_8844 [Ascobolus immersus RN42]
MAPKTPKRSTPSTTTLVKEQAQPILTLQVRPFPNSLSHKTFLRVHVHRAILKTLDISPGSLVLLSPAPDPTDELDLESLDLSDDEEAAPKPKKKAVKQWPAQIWTSSDPQLQVKSAQLGEWLRQKVGLGFADKIIMRRYAEDDEGYRSIREVKVVEVEELLEGKGGKTLNGDPPMQEKEKEGWRWFLEHVLGR